MANIASLPMSLHLKEFQHKIFKNKGLHINFAYPCPYRPNPNNDMEQFELPIPIYFGLTVRVFFYAPAWSKTHTQFDVFRIGHHNYQFYAGAIVEGNVVKLKYSGRGVGNEGTETTGTRIKIPGYYTMAVRFKTEHYFGILYEDDELKSVRQWDFVDDDKWNLRLWATDHYLVSLHVSDEIENNPNFPEGNLRQGYSLGSIPVLGPGSSWTMRCILTRRSETTLVYIGTHYSGDLVQIPATFNSNSLNLGDQFNVYVMNTSGAYLITTSFDMATKRVGHGPSYWGSFIIVGVSDNCQILKEFAVTSAATSYVYD